ncbi:hypothetical protein [Botrimarina sp.]|uniref:hypothetical protein n=1 Tax=Botrimarina sp. TaxID=2795802 RepID=UPI0032EE8BD5
MLALSCGCNSSKFEFAEVRGRVVLDGKPVSEAKVVFMPTTINEDGESGPYSQGLTDSDGRYELTTQDEHARSGAVVGRHRVVVSTKQAHLAEGVMDREIIDVPESIPRKYTHYRETPLVFEVPTGGADDADFSLESPGR